MPTRRTIHQRISDKLQEMITQETELNLTAKEQRHLAQCKQCGLRHTAARMTIACWQRIKENKKLQLPAHDDEYGPAITLLRRLLLTINLIHDSCPPKILRCQLRDLFTSLLEILDANPDVLLHLPYLILPATIRSARSVEEETRLRQDWCQQLQKNS